MRSLYVLLVMLLCTINTNAQYYEQGEAPNVLFFMVGDLNDWIGALKGHPNAKTPNIDRLAEKGVLFTNAQSPSSQSSASRASIFTGLQPTTTGIYKAYQRLRRHIGDRQTMPEYFKSNGYYTMRSGRVFSQFDKTDEDSWNDAFPSLKKHSPKITVPRRISDKKDIKQYRWDIEKLEIDDEMMDDGQVAQWAAQQLEKEYTQPFFLTVGFSHPGLPWMVPKKYFEMHPMEDIVLPIIKNSDREDVPEISKSKEIARRSHERFRSFSKSMKTWQERIQGYLATCSFVDAQIGKVLDALDESEYGDDTIIVLCSDNGFHLGEKMMWSKFSLWEEATHVPLIITGGKNFTLPKGEKVDAPISLVNLYPTLINLCELPFNPMLDGNSMDDLIFNSVDEWTKPAITTFLPNNHSLRTKKWRYTKWSDGSEELYDHENDPNEWINLANSNNFNMIKAELSWYVPKKVQVVEKKGRKIKTTKDTFPKKQSEFVNAE